jgi:formate/nitrite transporter FocA (FNT family)
MKTFLSAILAGIFISVGCIVNLNVGGVAGAVLFAFGLLAVVHYKLDLYTGTAGFFNFRDIEDWWPLFLILAGNIVGCYIMALSFGTPELVEKCAAIVRSRASHGTSVIALAAGCGLIMTTAVQFARQDKFLPLLFGVPVFILCGFAHSIADAFYFSLGASGSAMPIYLMVVLGNLIGCNLPRFFIRNH